MDTRKLTIRRATEADARELGRVHAQSWRAAYAGIIPQSYLSTVTPRKRAQIFWNNMREKTAEYYLALDEGVAVGLLILSPPGEADAPPNSIEAAAIYLLPLYWGQGYGKQLLDFATATAREAGCKVMLLWVLEENHRARRLYEKYGFAPDGARQTIERGAKLEQLRYRLEL